MYAEKGIGFSIGNSLSTAGESYEEYSFAEEDPIKVVRHVVMCTVMNHNQKTTGPY